MNAIVNFILESGVSFSVFCIIYLIFLRKETYFRLNRFIILGSVFFSVVLPFLKLKVLDTSPVVLSEITVTPYKNLLEVVTIYGKDLSGNIEKAIISANIPVLIYSIGFIMFITRFLWRLITVNNLVVKNKVQRFDGFILVLLDKEFSPFSFLNYVFVSGTVQNKQAYEKMLAHELEHVRQKHSWDVILFEVLSVFQWFNPFVWILKRLMRENHEFLVDEAILKAGTKRSYYKKLLLDQYIGGEVKLVNGFNNSLIKSRIKMMSRIRSSKTAVWKILFGIAAAFGLVLFFGCEQKEAYAKNSKQIFEDYNISVSIVDDKLKIKGTSENLEKVKNWLADTDFEFSLDSLGSILLEKQEASVPESDEPNETVFYIVENMPQFPGGDEALNNYISNIIEYPEIAYENNIFGKVFVSFVVTKNGDIADARVSLGVDPSLDKEALRVVNSLPKWKPGIQRGEPVNVSYTLPINFSIY